jgi:hypothetical protein
MTSEFAQTGADFRRSIYGDLCAGGNCRFSWYWLLFEVRAVQAAKVCNEEG